MTLSDGGGQRSGPADSDLGPAGGPVELYVLRLPTQARPRGISHSPSAGTRFPQVAGMDRCNTKTTGLCKTLHLMSVPIWSLL